MPARVVYDQATRIQDIQKQEVGRHNPEEIFVWYGLFFSRRRAIGCWAGFFDLWVLHNNADLAISGSYSWNPGSRNSVADSFWRKRADQSMVSWYGLARLCGVN